MPFDIDSTDTDFRSAPTDSAALAAFRAAYDWWPSFAGPVTLRDVPLSDLAAVDEAQRRAFEDALRAFKKGDAVPPIWLNDEAGVLRVADGGARLAAARAAGVTHVHVFRTALAERKTQEP